MKKLMTLLFLGFMAGTLIAQPNSPRSSQIVSPEINSDNSVTFRLNASEANRVTISGDWMSSERFARASKEMTKGDDGVWSYTSEVLSSGIYYYSFSMDGLSVVDPANTEQVYVHSNRSSFVIPGSDKAWVPIPETPKGTVTQHFFHSVVTNDDRDFWVYLPPNYDAHRSESYPVLVLQHGWGDDATAWIQQGAATTLDNLINQGKAVPMIMVNSLGYGTANGAAGIDAPEMQGNFIRILNTEVMPIVFTRYNASTKQVDHSIAGLSMGGGETICGGLNSLNMFAWFGSFSGAFNNWAQTIPFAIPPAGPAVQSAVGEAVAFQKAAQAKAQSEGQEAYSGTPGLRLQFGATPPALPKGTIIGPAKENAIGQEAETVGMTGAGPLFEARLPLLLPNLSSQSNDQIRLLWIAVGTRDGLVGVNRQLKHYLDSKGVRSTYTEYPNFGHEWSLWRVNFVEFAQKIFK